jgi:tetratricopeptide (TPR) repeat protein
MSSTVGKILDFIPKQPDKFGFERVKKRKKGQPSVRGQLNLFAPAAQVLKLPSTVGPFEEALLLDEREDSGAEEAYRRAIEEGDDVADAYCNLGIIMSKRGMTAKAFDCFTKSLEHNARHFESHFNLGNLYFEAGDLRLARVHYELAAEIEPDHAGVYFNLGLVAAITNDLTAALDSLKKYKSLASTDEGKKADDLLENLQRSLRAQR